MKFVGRSMALRRARATGLAAWSLALMCGACETTAPGNDWEDRLHGDAVVLLGEVHDNAQQHRLRLEVLQRAFAAGWRPAIAMEQFDREHQHDIDRARREQPADAQHVIDLATAPSTRVRGGWNWDYYRPFVALALQYDVPLFAADLSNEDTTRIVRGGYGAVFDQTSIVALGLNEPVPANLQSAQEREIDAGHCHLLPQDKWPQMARAQFARDAVMAEVLRQHTSGGVVLLAGNGHVRRDIGVPRWLRDGRRQVLTIGYLEIDDDSTPVAAFDAVVRTAIAERADPCAGLEKRTRSN